MKIAQLGGSYSELTSFPHLTILHPHDLLRVLQYKSLLKIANICYNLCSDN